MECNKEEAERALALAETKLSTNDYVAARRLVARAERLSPNLPRLQHLSTLLDVLLSSKPTRSIPTSSNDPDYYAILNVSSSAATFSEIRRQYRKLALLLHPDKNPFPAAAEAFQLVAQAWAVLSNNTARATYDAKHSHIRRPPQPPPAAGTRSAPPQGGRKGGVVSCTNCREKGWAVERGFITCHRCFKPFFAIPQQEQNPTTDGSAGKSNGEASVSGTTKKSSPNSSRKSPRFSHEDEIPEKPESSKKPARKESESSKKAAGKKLVAEESESSKKAAGKEPVAEESESSKKEPAAEESESSKKAACKNPVLEESESLKKAAHKNPVPEEAESLKKAAPKNPVPEEAESLKKAARKNPVPGKPKNNPKNKENRSTDTPANGRNGESAKKDILNAVRNQAETSNGGIPARKHAPNAMGKQAETSNDGSPARKHTSNSRQKQVETSNDAFPARKDTPNAQAETSNGGIPARKHAPKVRRKKVETSNGGRPSPKTAKKGEEEDSNENEMNHSSSIPSSSNQNTRKEESVKIDISDNVEAPPVEESPVNSSPFRRRTRNQSQEGFSYPEPSRKKSKTSNAKNEEVPVPDGEFYAFADDRSADRFEPSQVWALYDDDDKMPRFYAQILKVFSKDKFKVKFQYLEAKKGVSEEIDNWTSAGCYLSWGEFILGDKIITECLGWFSHEVQFWENTEDGNFRVMPGEGEVWAMYKKWSSSWDGSEPKEIKHVYEMVEVVSFLEDNIGFIIVPLIKVEGFTAVFRRGVKRVVPIEERLRFSHSVPSKKLSGNEDPRLLNNFIYLELDPAALQIQ